MPVAIEIEGLCHNYGDRKALAGIDLEIQEGEIFGLLGPNGGGKTTLFRILCTLLAPSEGQVRILGMDVLQEITRVRRRIGVVFQNPSLDPNLTVWENLYHQGHLYGLSGRALSQRVDEVLALVRIADRARDRVEILSGGLKRRVDLAKGLLHRPSVLIFDEPSTGLDPGARRAFWNDLEALRASDGITLLLTTHFMEEAERCDRVAILDEGQLVAHGTPGELKRDVGQDVIVIETEQAASLIEEIRDRFEVQPFLLDGTVRIECEDGQELLSSLYAAFRERLDAITLGRPTLEDVFVSKTGRSFQSGGA
ncbi:MAG: ATP-binding cassette domain-containing protein [bacterium]|nr:ATP-binding cassette domain-containing protein [bacterium]